MERRTARSKPPQSIGVVVPVDRLARHADRIQGGGQQRQVLVEVTARGSGEQGDTGSGHASKLGAGRLDGAGSRPCLPPSTPAPPPTRSSTGSTSPARRVLVTGASAGLGVETARALTAHGASVVAGVRDQAKATAALDAAGVPTRLRRAAQPSTWPRWRRCGRSPTACPRRPRRLRRADRQRRGDGLPAGPDRRRLRDPVRHQPPRPLHARQPAGAAPAPTAAAWSASRRPATGSATSTSTTRTSSTDAVRRVGRLRAVEDGQRPLRRRARPPALRDRGVRAAAVHPGMIYTELGRHMTDETIDAGCWSCAGRAADRGRSRCPQGAATSVWAAAVADAGAVGGRYCEDCAVSPVIDDGEPSRPASCATPSTPTRARALWTRVGGAGRRDLRPVTPRSPRWRRPPLPSAPPAPAPPRWPRCAELLGRLEPDEVVPVVAMLSGTVRQGRIGVGWATVAKLDVDARATASPTPRGRRGRRRPRRARRRRRAGLGRRAPRPCSPSCSAGPPSAGGRPAAPPAHRRAAPGRARGARGRRRGRGADVPAAVVRRAAMLAGDLPAVAAVALHGEGGEALEAIGLTVGTAGAADAGGDSAERWPRRSGAPARRRWSGSSTAPASRPTATATTCASSPATSTTSPTGCPASSRWCRSFPAEPLVLDGEAMSWARRRASRRVPGHDVVVRAPARRRRRAARRPRFFDVLHVDGEDLLDRPLRRAPRGARPRGRRRPPSPAWSPPTPQAADAFADDALAPATRASW